MLFPGLRNEIDCVLYSGSSSAHSSISTKAKRLTFKSPVNVHFSKKAETLVGVRRRRVVLRKVLSICEYWSLLIMSNSNSDPAGGLIVFDWYSCKLGRLKPSDG